MPFETLPERLRIAVGSDQSFRQIAERVGMHPETVRRYMHGSSIPAEFVVRICQEYGVSANWLLLGAGPRSIQPVDLDSIRTIPTPELLALLAGRLEGGESPE